MKCQKCPKAATGKNGQRVPHDLLDRPLVFLLHVVEAPQLRLDLVTAITESL